jgi:hypothetical protein
MIHAILSSVGALIIAGMFLEVLADWTIRTHPDRQPGRVQNRELR